MRKYKNGKYDNLIESKVAEMTFQDEYKPFVIDMLKRRTLQFDFKEEQVSTDLDRLSKSLIKITARNIGINFLGAYYLLEKRLNLNSLTNVFLTNGELYDTFTHELYHALLMEDGRDKMVSINKFSGQENISLLEIIVSEASYRTVFQLKTKNPYYNSNCKGYKKMAFAIDMLAATFGISEQEFLQNAIQGRDRLIKFLAMKFHGNCTDKVDAGIIEDFLDQFELNLAVIHRNIYGDSNEKDIGLTKGKNMAEAMGRMKKVCANMMRINLINMPEEELTPQKIEDLKFNFNKFNVVVNKGAKNIMKSLGFSQKRADELSKETMEYYANAIMQMEYLMDFKKTHTFPEYFKVFEYLARYGILQDFDEITYKLGLDNIKLNNFEIEVPERVGAKNIFNISSETIDRNKVPKEKTEAWDNSIVKEMRLKKLLRKTSFKENITIIKNFIMGENGRALPPGNDGEKKEKNIADISLHNRNISWFIPEEEVKIINLNSKKIAEKFNKKDEKNRESPSEKALKNDEK